MQSFGLAIDSPERRIVEFRQALTALCREHVADEKLVEKYYFTLGKIIGEHTSQRARLKADKIVPLLKSMAKGLKDTSRLLAGLETGFRSDVEIAVARCVIEALENDAGFGSPDATCAKLSSFRADADAVSRACLVASDRLPKGNEKRGAKRKDWYDDFVRLLLTIGKEAGLKPVLHNRGHDDGVGGWLLDIAIELETFLPKRMRSPGRSACAKRINRSKQRMRQI
jgi:hypothetical protein